MIQCGLYVLLSASRRAYFCKSIAIEMGGASRYFSKISESGFDFRTPRVYAYPNVSEFAGRSSDHGPSKTQTKTQATPDSVFTRERRNSWSKLLGRETQTMV